jgi:hypothetical protein
LTRITLAVAFGLALWQFTVGLAWIVMGFLGDRKNAFAGGVARWSARD